MSCLIPGNLNEILVSNQMRDKLNGSHFVASEQLRVPCPPPTSTRASFPSHISLQGKSAAIPALVTPPKPPILVSFNQLQMSRPIQSHLRKRKPRCFPWIVRAPAHLAKIWQTSVISHLKGTMSWIRLLAIFQVWIVDHFWKVRGTPAKQFVSFRH